jgi:hypothetical protein
LALVGALGVDAADGVHLLRKPITMDELERTLAEVTT